MTNTLVYNIPVEMLPAYRGRNVIVRSRDPAEIVRKLAVEDLERVAYVQVLNLHADLQPLMSWGDAIPVDLVIQNAETDLPLLYQCSQLLSRHPVRITVPVVSGFSKVVKLAASLNLAIKLDVSQPEGELIEEMSQVLQAYLHQPMVSQPMEYFHSIFLAFYRSEPLTLWTVQEEDPACFCYIADDGEETLSRRFAVSTVNPDIAQFPDRFKQELLAAGGECSECEFLENCSGYFKWPKPEYQCDGVKSLFQTLQDAAHQLKKDLGAFQSGCSEERS